MVASIGVSREEALALARDGRTDPEVLDQIARIYVSDEEVLRVVAFNPKVGPSTLIFLGEIVPPALAEAMARDEGLLLKCPALRKALGGNPALKGELKALISLKTEEAPAKVVEKPLKKGLQQIIKELTVGQKLALSKRGNKEARMLLVKDANEMIALEVVSNPRITDAEVLAIAQMREVSEKVLRAIASNKKYRANRLIVLSLLHNPKTPVGVSLGLGIGFLSDKDLQDLIRNRDISGAVSRAAKAVLEKRKRPPAGAGH